MENLTRAVSVQSLFYFLFLSFPAAAAVAITPALPWIASEFGLLSGQAQWLMSLYLIGYMAGQLIYGRVAERTGQKNAVYLGLAVALIGSAIAYSAASFEILCFARFVQGLGAAAGLILTFSMASSLSKPKEKFRFLSAFAIVPAAAAVLGGALTDRWGWKSCFLFLIAYSLFLALFASAAVENKKGKRVELSRYAAQFKDSFLVWHALLVGLGVAAIYLFASYAPFVGIDGMGLDAGEYGLWMILPGLGALLGLGAQEKIAKRTPPRIVMLSGILVLLIGSLLMSLSFANRVCHPGALFWPMFLIQIGIAIVCSSAFAKGISESADKSDATAVLHFVNLAVASAAVIAAGSFCQGWLLLPMALFLVSAAMVVVWLELKEHHAKTK